MSRLGVCAGYGGALKVIGGIQSEASHGLSNERHRERNYISTRVEYRKQVV